MKDTLTFFEIAKPSPTQKDFQTQLGCWVEESEELLEAMALHPKLSVRKPLNDLAKFYKESEELLSFQFLDKLKFADAVCDIIITATGTARALGIDIEGAYKEVEASNLSKFVHFPRVHDISDNEWMDFDKHSKLIEASGKYKNVWWGRIGDYIVWYDENGKILKGPNYFEPKLEKYI